MTALAIKPTPHRTGQPTILTADTRNAVAVVNPERTFCVDTANIYADKIVRAVNVHEVLVAALREIAENDHNCTCREDSWYGENHAEPCPIAVADAALAKMEP